MRIKKSVFLIILILLIAAFLRIWRLNNIPPSLTQDEASLGYNAYSLLKTGKDEYGKFLPLIFKSFGDYKPGLYVYTVIPFVAVNGLNEWAVRLPSALAGIMTVYLIYLITGSLSGRSKKLAFIAAFLSAVNPWLIFFSRGAWEANLSLTLTLAGIYFFLMSLRSVKYLPFSGLFFASTFLTYQGAKLSTSIVLVILAITFWKESYLLVIKEKRTVALSLIPAFIICIPVVWSFFTGQTGRLSVFSIFSYPRPGDYLQTFLSQGKETPGDIGYYLYHSEPLNFARGIMGRWFNHFSGKFLFFTGDYQNPMHSAPNSGMLQLFDLILLPLGFVYVIRQQKNDKKLALFSFLWLFTSPLPAILSRDQVQSVRALNMAVPLVIFSAYGLNALLIWLSEKKYKMINIGISAAVFIVSFIYFTDSYFVHSPIHNAKYWLYGYKQVINEIAPIENKYDRIIFQQGYSQPYIFFLFYQKYDPRKYQQEASWVSGGSDVGLVSKLDNIEFDAFSWPPAIDPKQKTLVVGDPVAIPPDFSQKDFKLISEIKYPDGYQTAFRIIEANEKN